MVADRVSDWLIDSVFMSEMNFILMQILLQNYLATKYVVLSCGRAIERLNCFMEITKSGHSPA